MKKRNKREKTKYSSLDRSKNLKSRRYLIDFDYLDKLSEEELSFLNKYVSEAIVTDFNHHPDMKRLIAKKKQIIEDDIYIKTKNELDDLKKFPRKNEKKIKETKEILRLIKKQNQELSFPTSSSTTLG